MRKENQPFCVDFLKRLLKGALHLFAVLTIP